MTLRESPGLHGLISPETEEQKIVQLVRKRLEHTASSKYSHSDSQDFFQKNLNFLTFLEKHVQHLGINGCSSQAKRFPCIRCVISILAETTACFFAYGVCRAASDHVLVVPTKTKYQLDLVSEKLRRIQKELLSLHLFTVDIIESTKSYGCSDYQDVVAVAKQADSLQYLLDACNHDLQVAIDTINRKCCFEVRFFNTASTLTGMAAAGRLAWSLFNGDECERLIYAGLWSICVGASSAVLQIPRMRASDVRHELEENSKFISDIRFVTKTWNKVNDWSYAKFVRKPIENSALSLKQDAKFM